MENSLIRQCFEVFEKEILTIVETKYSPSIAIDIIFRTFIHMTSDILQALENYLFMYVYSHNVHIQISIKYVCLVFPVTKAVLRFTFFEIAFNT